MYIYIFALYILFAPWSYTSHRLMFFVVNTTENKAYLILSYSCAKSNVEVKAPIMDIQQAIPLHIQQWM